MNGLRLAPNFGSARQIKRLSGNISSNSDGLNVYPMRAAGSFLLLNRSILFFGEYVAQTNGWYVEPGYQFAVPWNPIVTVRNASCSGDRIRRVAAPGTPMIRCFVAPAGAVWLLAPGIAVESTVGMKRV